MVVRGAQAGAPLPCPLPPIRRLPTVERMCASARDTETRLITSCLLCAGLSSANPASKISNPAQIQRHPSPTSPLWKTIPIHSQMSGTLASVVNNISQCVQIILEISDPLFQSKGLFGMMYQLSTVPKRHVVPLKVLRAKQCNGPNIVKAI